MDLMFSPFGRVKRIKVPSSLVAIACALDDSRRGVGQIYRDDSGKPKGDALVTFVKVNSTANAVNRLNGHEVEPGRPLHVSLADFSAKLDDAAEDEPDDEAYENDEIDEAVMREQQTVAVLEAVVGPLNPDDFTEDGVPRFTPLPAECQPDLYPTCVLRNLYTAEQVRGLAAFSDPSTSDC
jgi:RNA recognition motif-containing protein